MPEGLLKMVSVDRRKIAHFASLFMSNATGTILSQVIALIVIPLQLKYLGVEQYGLIVLFNSFVAAGTLADIGIGPTVIRFVAHTERHPKALAHVFSSAFTVITILAVAIIVLANILAYVYQLFFLESSSVAGLDLYILVALVVFGIVISMFTGLALNVLRGLRLYRSFAVFETTIRLIIPVSSTIASALFHDVGVTLLISCCVNMIATIFLLRWVAKIVKSRYWITTNLRYFQRKMFHFSRWVWIQAVFGFLGSQADRLIIAATMGFSNLAIYGIAMSLANAANAALYAGSGFLMPEITHKLSDKQWLEKYYKHFTFLFSFVSAVVIVLALPFIKLILNLWLTAPLALQVTPILLPVLWTISSTATSIPGTQFMNTMGYTRFAALLGMANNTVLLLGLFIFGSIYGLYGVLFAKLLAVPIGFVARIVTAHHIFRMKRPVWESFKMVSPTLVGTLVILPISWVILTK